MLFFARIQLSVGSRKASRKNRAKFGKSGWQDPARPFVCYRLIDTGHKKTIYRFEHGGYTPEVTKILKRLLVKGEPCRSVSPPGRRGPKKIRVRHLHMVEEGSFSELASSISASNARVFREKSASLEKLCQQ